MSSQHLNNPVNNQQLLTHPGHFESTVYLAYSHLLPGAGAGAAAGSISYIALDLGGLGSQTTNDDDATTTRRQESWSPIT